MGERRYAVTYTLRRNSFKTKNFQYSPLRKECNKEFIVKILILKFTLTKIYFSEIKLKMISIIRVK